MSTIHRSDFLRNHANQSLDLSRVDQATQQKLEAAGSSAQQVANADLNRDGKIQGQAELQALFRHIDGFDRNGSGSSFLEKNTTSGEATRSGQIYNALSLQFAEASGHTSVTRPQDGLATWGRQLATGGAQSIANKMGGHLDSIDKTGVGHYFGDHSSMKSMNQSERADWIRSNAQAGTQPPTAGELRESSCIGWAMENVKAAYVAAGKADRWDEIQRTVLAKGSKGTDLAKELKKDGWESVYWNPDAKKPADGNAEHSYSAAMVRRGNPYYGIPIDHQVLNYRPSTDGATTQDMSGIEKLREVPFFFGLAKGGMHTFVGREGKVNEFHWTAMPNDRNAIEERPLEQFPWLSGVIMVPPGSWPR